MDYSIYSKDQLIDLLKRRETTTPLGIVWERDEIEYDRALNDDFVAMEVHPELSTGDAPWTNILIEGDNFDALRYLRMTFKGKVKVICIDPPYNTGNKDFIYNDKFLNKDDRFKHSVWLEFMYRRLVLAKELLRNDGVIFVNIGEEEFGHLAMLMDKVFPGMKIGTFVWKRRSGSNDAKGAFLSVDHEYVLCYANPEFTFAGETKGTGSYTNPNEDPRGAWANDNLNVNKTYRERPNTYYPLQNPENKVWYPCNPDRVWGFASESRLKPGQKIRAKTIEQIIREDKVIWPKDDKTVFYLNMEELLAAIEDGTSPRNLRKELPELEFWVGKIIGLGMPRYKKHLLELKRSEKPLSTWIIPKSSSKEDIKLYDSDDTEVIVSGYTSDGTALLRKMLGQNDFPYPKPLALIKGLLQQATGSDDIILDFFGGSATTAHAVMMLNEEDDGNRRFIVVSSTEATENEPEKNICRDIARVRLDRVINGYTFRSGQNTTTVDPLPGDFAYLTMSRIPSEYVGNLISHDQIWIALQLINNGRVYPYLENEPFQVAEYDDRVIIYLQEASNDAISKIDRAIRQFPAAIIYSWTPAVIRRDLTHPGVTVEKIPEFLMQCFGGL